MFTRRFVALLATLLLALGVTACGGGETTTDGGTGDTVEDGTGTDGTGTGTDGTGTDDGGMSDGMGS